MLPDKYSYRPLPKGFKIGKSEIEGQGLFSFVNINANVTIGVSHVINNGKLIRTPLSGFVNHSETPNCIITSNEAQSIYYLKTLLPIKKGNELTVNYNKSLCGFNANNKNIFENVIKKAIYSYSTDDTEYLKIKFEDVDKLINNILN